MRKLLTPKKTTIKNNRKSHGGKSPENTKYPPEIDFKKQTKKPTRTPQFIQKIGNINLPERTKKTEKPKKTNKIKSKKKLENGTRSAQIPRKPLTFPSPNKQTDEQTDKQKLLSTQRFQLSTLAFLAQCSYRLSYWAVLI